MRFAVLVQSGQSAFAPTFEPRVRRHLAQGRRDLTAQEYGVARVPGFCASLLLALAFTLAGRPLLVVFGEFGAVFDAFMLLVAAHLFSVGVGFHGAFLTMTAEIGWSTANGLVGLAAFGLLLVLLVPRHDAVGAFLISTLLHDCLGIAILRRRLGIVAIGVADAALVGGASLAPVGLGLGLVAQGAAAGALGGVLALTAARHRGPVGRVLRTLGGILRGRAG